MFSISIKHKIGMGGIEPPTPATSMQCSPIELHTYNKLHSLNIKHTINIPAVKRDQGIYNYMYILINNKNETF